MAMAEVRLRRRGASGMLAFSTSWLPMPPLASCCWWGLMFRIGWVSSTGVGGWHKGCRPLTGTHRVLVEHAGRHVERRDDGLALGLGHLGRALNHGNGPLGELHAPEDALDGRGGRGQRRQQRQRQEDGEPPQGGERPQLPTAAARRSWCWREQSHGACAAVGPRGLVSALDRSVDVGWMDGWDEEGKRMSGPDLRTRCAGGGRICSAKDRTFGSIEVDRGRACAPHPRGN